MPAEQDSYLAVVRKHEQPLHDRITRLEAELQAAQDREAWAVTVLLEEGLLLPTEMPSEEWVRKYRAAQHTEEPSDADEYARKVLRPEEYRATQRQRTEEPSDG